MRRILAARALAAFCLIAAGPGAAAGQDLFELEVFEYETTPARRHEVTLHANVISRNAAASDSAAADHRPLHLSVELTRGWTDRFEGAVFVQSAPLGSSASTRLAGGHVRGKMRIGRLPPAGVGLSLSAEYGFNRRVFDEELQTLEVRSILEHRAGRLSLIANPSVEFITWGSEKSAAPVFDISARAAWELTPRVTVASDYFSAAASTRHLQPEPTAHHLLFAGAEIEVGGRWDIGISAGHCVTRREPWLLRSTLSFEF